MANDKVIQRANQDAVTILLKEYEHLIQEIRNIHDKRMSMFKFKKPYATKMLG